MPRDVIIKWAQGEFELVVSTYLLYELQAALSRPPSKVTLRFTTTQFFDPAFASLTQEMLGDRGNVVLLHADVLVGFWPIVGGAVVR